MISISYSFVQTSISFKILWIPADHSKPPTLITRLGRWISVFQISNLLQSLQYSVQNPEYVTPRPI